MTQVKIQFCLLGTIFTTKFAKIKDREIAPFEHWFEFCRLFNKRFRECKQTLSVLDEVRVRWLRDALLFLGRQGRRPSCAKTRDILEGPPRPPLEY